MSNVMSAMLFTKVSASSISSSESSSAWFGSFIGSKSDANLRRRVKEGGAFSGDPD